MNKTENICETNGSITVRSLRRANWTVNVTHLRRFKGQKNLLVQKWQTSDPNMIEPKGGQTEAFIIAPDGRSKARGIALCSNDDSYCKQRGISLALERAIAELKES